MPRRTHYDVLQVAADASPEMIAGARRTLPLHDAQASDLGGDGFEAA